MSNAVGNECSESMREMCGRVSFSVRANAQVYAPRSSWNVQELKEAARLCPVPPSFSLSLLLFTPTSLPIILPLSLSLSSPLMLSDCALFQTPPPPPSSPAGRSFGQKQKPDVSLHVATH